MNITIQPDSCNSLNVMHINHFSLIAFCCCGDEDSTMRVAQKKRVIPSSTPSLPSPQLKREGGKGSCALLIQNMQTSMPISTGQIVAVDTAYVTSCCILPCFVISLLLTVCDKGKSCFVMMCVGKVFMYSVYYGHFAIQYLCCCVIIVNDSFGNTYCTTW